MYFPPTEQERPRTIGEVIVSKGINEQDYPTNIYLHINHIFSRCINKKMLKNG